MPIVEANVGTAAQVAPVVSVTSFLFLLEMGRTHPSRATTSGIFTLRSCMHRVLRMMSLFESVVLSLHLEGS